MARRGTLRLIFHGTIFLAFGMLVGFPGFLHGPPKSIDDEFRLFFRQSHLIPIATGIWLIASGVALPTLNLKNGRASLLVWSLIVSSYSLLLAQGVWFTALQLGWTEKAGKPVMHTPLAPLYIGALIVVATGAVIGNTVMLLGAFSALRELDHPVGMIH
jgi:hypothetical protein